MNFTQRPVTAEDLFKIAFVSNATISHDGRRVAFVVMRADLKENAYLANLWIAESDGSRVAQLTRGGNVHRIARRLSDLNGLIEQPQTRAGFKCRQHHFAGMTENLMAILEFQVDLELV